MKKILLLAPVLSVCLTLCGEATDATSKLKINLPPGMDFRDYILAKRYGGMIVKPGSGSGEILIVNGQDKVPVSELGKIETCIKQDFNVTTRISKESQKAQMTIEVVDRPGETTLAVYPDDSRAVVNVAALGKDEPDAAKLAARVRKEALRAFVYLAGGASIKGCEGTLMDATTDLTRLDAASEGLPGELLMRSPNYLKRIGIQQYQRSSYLQACKEGWAPQPTNEFQKAVWDKVYTMPDKPIKIQKKKADK